LSAFASSSDVAPAVACASAVASATEAPMEVPQVFHAMANPAFANKDVKLWIVHQLELFQICAREVS